MIFNTAIVFGKIVIALSNLHSYDEINELPNLLGWLLIRVILTLIAIYNANLVIQEVSSSVVCLSHFVYFFFFTFTIGQKNFASSA